MNEFKNYVPTEAEMQLAEESMTEEQRKLSRIQEEEFVIKIESIKEDYRIAKDLESTVDFYRMAMCIPEGYIGEDGLRKYSASSPENYAEAQEVIKKNNEALTNMANKYGIEATRNGNGAVRISEKLKEIMELK